MDKINLFTKKTQRYDSIALAFCMVVLLVALVIGYFHKVGTFGVESDFYGSYAVQAENIIAGRPYTYQLNPPGYCLLLATVTLLTGDTFVAGKVISAFAAALFGWITYLLLKALFDSRIALTATILSLLTLIPSSFVAATDVVGAVVIMLPLWVFLRPSGLTNACFLSGILAGVAYLVRGNAIFVSIGILISLVFIAFNKQTLQHRLMKVGIFTFGVLLITFPWFIYSWYINGNPFTSNAYLQIAAHFYHLEGDKFGTAATEMSSQFNSFSEVLLYDPLRLLKLYFKDVLFLNIPRLFVPQSLIKNLDFPAYGIVMAGPLLLVSIGFILLLGDILSHIEELSRKKLIFVLVNFMGYLLLGLVGFHRRYYLFLFPLIFLLIVYPFFRKRVFAVPDYTHFPRTVSCLLVIILAFSLSGAAYLETKSIIASEPRYLLEIAEFLKSYSSPNEVLISRKPHLAYLAKLKGVFPLVKTADEYLVKAREIKASYIVYSDYEASLWPGLKSLSNPKALPDGFKLIYCHQLTNTLIYKIDLDVVLKFEKNYAFSVSRNRALS